MVTAVDAQWKQTTGPWTEVTYSLAVGDSLLYAGTYAGGVFLSSDYGDSWNEIDGGMFPSDDSGFTRKDIKALALIPEGEAGINLFAGTDGHGVFRSIKADTNWMAINNGMTNLRVYALVVEDTNILAGTYGGTFFSTNNGTNWTPVNTELRGYWGFVVGRNTAGDTILGKLDGSGSVLRSTDNGANWLAVNPGWPSNAKVTALAVHDTIFYAGTSNHGIYYSLNGGINWMGGGGPKNVYSLAASGQYLFAGVGTPTIFTGSVWRRPLSEMLVGVRDSHERNPITFTLEQNFPNPFNPTTVINYKLSITDHVVLKVYDVLGREIAALVNEQKSEGTHNAEWRATSVSSGIYFYRLTSGNFAQTRKMILQR
jgi:hypothetical protein